MPEPQAPVRVVIVDDEPLARRTLRVLLQPEAGVEVVAEAGNGAEALDAIAATQPDLVFLDVQMPEMDGFEVLNALGPERTPAVIFVTAFDEHAVRAFDAEAADYLLKPFDDERFARALARARARIGDGRVRELASRLARMLSPDSPAPHLPATTISPSAVAETADAPRFAERIVVKKNSRVTLLDVQTVDWIEAADYVVRIHAGGAVHVLREPIADLEKRLDPRRFFRIHRSTIVNLASVKELQPLFHGEYVVIMRDGSELRLSRARRDRLQQLLGARI
ncbi:LytTR family DNA-binding domain-containing protein [Longimicrobium sp.]|uniref:LytR/AlgR family response regulator transcription factor n=1 Tax=Longimicrobium sp. TaxID=2029185 RepID=UPI002CBABF92|nr:LytTR family DNA-binding domain-containing protein [Longimicrobium sp.]HSU16810.1 LytTR family DNA-binding domain-containing protein [Longimicrobium sp.]